MYKIEMHMHTCHSSPCGKDDAQRIAQVYHEAEYSGIVVTDHFFRYTCRPDVWNIPYDQFFQRFTEGYRLLKEAAVPYGLKIYRGAEVRFDGSTNDYLLYNYPDALLQDPQAVFSMGLEKFSQLSREAGALLIQAHPNRDGCTVADPRFLDGVEVFNHHPTHNNQNHLTLEFAEQHPHLIRLSGSDYHRSAYFGRGGILTETLPENEAALVQILRQGNYTML